MLIHKCENGVTGGDWNSIIHKDDATNLPQSKMSPMLNRLAKNLEFKDSFRTIHLGAVQFSHFYKTGNTFNASRLDRQYHWGNIKVIKCEYLPVAMSDHSALF